MKRHLWAGLLALAAVSAGTQEKHTIPQVTVPRDLEVTLFSPNTLTPCVSCLCAAPTGEVFVGIDQIGSLGKGGGKGRVLRLVDTNHDGVADRHTVFATIDNPRGLISIGKDLYILHTDWDGKTFMGMYLSVLTDADGDGVADGPPKKLVSQISTKKFNQARGVDHTTNGIRMGIDGWIYVAIGDFGFVDATGTDGRKLTMYGGGVVRVRPDGTELETYVHGLRNIYDVAIDPSMNLFTRGNTNDGGGWNIRFIHEVQSGEYGYPTLFKRYTEEIIPALVDVGGGSGTGAMFFQEPGWPAKYTGVPMMCDWGRGELFIHRVTPDGASFTQSEEKFIRCSKITDVDVDGSGRLYLGSWHGSNFNGGTGGFVARVTPVGWKHKPFPDLRKATDPQLAGHFRSESATLQLHVQQEFLRRGRAEEVRKVATDQNASRAARIAAIFTLKQILGAKSHPDLLQLTQDGEVAEHALRALADRTTQNADVPSEPFVLGLKSPNPRVRVAAAVGLGRIGKIEGAGALLSVANPPGRLNLPTPRPPAAARKLHRSKTVRHRETAAIDVDVTGWRKLVLAVDDAGDGNGNDHGSWFEPTLITKSGKRIKLTDLTWKRAKGGWGKTLVDRNCTGKPLARHDRKPVAYGIGTHSPSVIEYEDLPKDVVRFTAVGGIATSGRGTVRFIVSDSTAGLGGTGAVKEGPHAKPNPGIILPHVAVRSLVALNAVEPCVEAIDGPNRRGALWALRHLHSTGAANRLIGKLKTATDPEARYLILKALVRIAHKERPYDGSHWWGTRPDTRGPYYYPTPWEGTEMIQKALLEAASRDAQARTWIVHLATKDRVALPGLSDGKAPSASGPVESPVDLEKIRNKKGEVGRMGVEDVLVALGKVKGDPKLGLAVFNRQGCTACHSVRKGEPLKGPFMGQIGSIMNREKIAMSILRPSAEISQGFKSVLMRTHDNTDYSGFVTKRLSDQIELRDIKGKVYRIDPKKVAREKLLERSMMPEGLANGLTVKEFASLVDFLASQKK